MVDARKRYQEVLERIRHNVGLATHATAGSVIISVAAIADNALMEIERGDWTINEDAHSASPSFLNRPCTLAVTAGSSRFGTVVSQDECGVWFRGKLERDNPKERERTYFVPWTSVVWLEMEGE